MRKGQRVLSAMTILAIATAVALASGLEMASRSVEAELERTADVLAGSAELEITGGPAGVPEELLSLIEDVHGIRAAAPLLEATLRVRAEPHLGEALHLLGVDLLADTEVRAYKFNQDSVGARDTMRLILAEDSVVVTEELSHRLSLGLNETLELDSDTGPVDLKVQAILRGGGVADAFGGQVAVMDVYLMQALLERQGFLDRIDIVLEDDADLANVIMVVSQRIGGRATLRRAALRGEWVDSTINAIRFIIWAILVVGVLVAALLSFSTLSLSVDRRNREFAILRSTGLEPRRVRRLVYTDALLFSSVGTILGIVIGMFLSRIFVSILSSLSAYLQDVEIQQLTLSPAAVLIGVAVGIVVGILGSIEPAYRTTAKAPLEVIKNKGVANRRHHSTTQQTLSFFGLTSVWIFLAVGLVSIDPSVHLGLIFFLGLALSAAMARHGFPRLIRTMRPLMEALIPRIGRFIGTSLLERPLHTAITLATLSGVIAGVTVTMIAVSSLSYTLDDWTASQYPNGVFVVAGNPLGGKDRENISKDTTQLVRTTPGVRAVFDHYTTSIIYKGEEVLIAGSSMVAMAKHGRLPTIDTDPRKLALALARGEIAISDQFKKRFAIDTGDTLTLSTPRGPRNFRIAGVIRDYAGPTGSLNVDLAVFDGLWPRTGSTNLVIWIDGEIESVLAEIRRRTHNYHDLFFVYGDELKRYASSVVGQFTAMLDIASYLTAILGGIAIMNLLLGSTMERRREIALLRSAGATSHQIVALIIFDGMLVTSAGVVVGIVLGLACAYPMITGVVRNAFSWWVQFSVDTSELLILGLLFLVVGFLASLYPAWQIQGIPAREASVPE